MNRLTDPNQGATLRAKETKTKEEEIYLRLCDFENLREHKALFTREELNRAIEKVIGSLVNELKNKITREIVLTLLAQAEELNKKEQITYEQIEKIGLEIIKEIEGIKGKNNER